jgi:hypothetical protein
MSFAFGILAQMNISFAWQKWKTVLLHSVFVLMLVMAWYFFKERLYADSAYYIFHSVDSGSFVTANQRIVLAVSEIMSIAVYYLGGSLKTILLTWSLSHVLFYYILFVIVYHQHKNEKAGIALILLQAIGQVWLYYSPMLEICYGAAFLVVFSVLLSEKKFTPWRWFWLIILEILVLTSHPENFVLFFFVVMADIITNGFRKRIHLTFFAVLIGCIIFKTFTFSEYEGGKLGYMLDVNQNHQYENLWNKNYMRAVLDIFTGHYVVLIFFLFLATAGIVVKKKWKMLLLFYFCVSGFIVLINATNYASEFTRYNESLYYPLVPLITICFLDEFYFLLRGWVRYGCFIGLIAVTLISMNNIRKNGAYLKLRTMQMENIIHASRNTGSRKTLVRLENVEKERWVCNWSYPMESLLLSSISGPAGSVSLIADEDYDYRDTATVLTAQRFILRRWEIRDDDNMLPFYKITHGNYLALNHRDSLMTPEIFAGKVSLKIIPEKKVEAYSRIFFPVSIKNASGKQIPSLPIAENFFLVQIHAENKTSEMTIPLDIDLNDHYTEILSCPLSDLKKPYQLSVKLMVMNKEIASAEALVN